MYHRKHRRKHSKKHKKRKNRTRDNSQSPERGAITMDTDNRVVRGASMSPTFQQRGKFSPPPPQQRHPAFQVIFICSQFSSIYIGLAARLRRRGPPWMTKGLWG